MRLKTPASTFWVFSWLTLVLCGPYVSFQGLPLRLDHLLFPTLGVLVLVWLLFQQKMFCISKPILLFGAFVGLAFFSTVLALQNFEFSLNTVSLLADLENHLRIALILWLCAGLTKNYPVSVPTLLKALFWVCVLLAFFGVLQIWKQPDCIKPLYWMVKKFSIDWYTGRHSKGLGLVKECVGWRAVSVFYHPGNFSLFCVLVGSIFLLSKDRLGFTPISYWAGNFVIWWAAGLTVSKCFLGGIVFLGFYLLLRGRWLRLAQFFFLILMTFGALFVMSDDASRGFGKYFQIRSAIGLYNQFLGPRFGRLEQRIAKAQIPSSQVPEKQSSFTVATPFLFTLAPESLTAKTSEKIVWEKGYLAASLEVIKNHPWLGVGYVSNVSSGDSMFVHLMVRGGILGSLLFFYFLVVMVLQVWKKRNRDDQADLWVRESWIVCAVFFCIFGIAFPTFIQDRTGDVFWWIGGLLCFSKRLDSYSPSEKYEQSSKIGTIKNEIHVPSRVL